jgi:hypothetical protein
VKSDWAVLHDVKQYRMLADLFPFSLFSECLRTEQACDLEITAPLFSARYYTLHILKHLTEAPLQACYVNVHGDREAEYYYYYYYYY